MQLSKSMLNFDGCYWQVIDECHHTYNAHPFNDVLAYYRKQSVAEQYKTQVRECVIAEMFM